MARHHGRIGLLLLLIVGGVDCAGAKPSEAPVQAIIPAQPVAPSATSIEPDAGSDAAATAPEKPAADPSVCRGSAFDVDALPEACSFKVAAKAGADGAMKAALVLPSAKVKGGETIDVTMTWTNEGTSDVTLVFKPSCTRISLATYKPGTEKRADYIPGACGYGGGCGGSPAKIVVAPGGVVSKKLRYTTRIIKVNGECHDTDAGPLPPGKYDLRVEDVNPFFALAKVTEKTKTTLEVTR